MEPKEVAELVAKARREAFEEAARICDKLAEPIHHLGYKGDLEYGAEGCADAIRELIAQLEEVK